MFGEFDNTVTNLGDAFGASDYWDTEAREPVLKQQEYQFVITAMSKKVNAQKGSVGFEFTLQPYADDLGMPITDALVQSQTVKQYFYVGKQLANGSIQLSQYQNVLTEFLRSIDITPEKRPDLRTGTTWMFTEEAVKGIVVKGKVYWDQQKSNKEHPDTGLVPEKIDTNDPYTYVLWTKIAGLRGVRENGVVKKVFI